MRNQELRRGALVRQLLLTILLLFGAYACNRVENAPALEAEVGIQYEPSIIPVAVRISNRGEVSLKGTAGKLPTPIGTFSLFANVSFPERRTLTIIVGQKKHIYDLADKSFQVNLPNNLKEQGTIDYDGKGNIVVVIPEPDAPTPTTTNATAEARNEMPPAANSAIPERLPTASVAPSRPPTMSWTMTDDCDDRKGIRLRFYTSDRSLVWPNARQDYILGRAETRTFELDVTPGSSVCYGGRPDRVTSESWGLGIDGSKACKDCCYSGTTSAIKLRLTCPAYKSYEEQVSASRPAPRVLAERPSYSTATRGEQSYSSTPRYRQTYPSTPRYRQNDDTTPRYRQNYDSAPRYGEYRSPRTGEDFDNRRRSPRARKEALYSGEHQLKVRVTGSYNQIAISEVENPDDADIGSFLVDGARQSRRYQLLADTGGVIHIQGDGNRVYLPAYLCRRIRVIPEGTDNQIYGCD